MLNETKNAETATDIYTARSRSEIFPKDIILG